MLQIDEPAKVNIINFKKFIFSIPASMDIISLIPGASLPKNTAFDSCLSNQCFVLLISFSIIPIYLPNFKIIGIPILYDIK